MGFILLLVAIFFGLPVMMIGAIYGIIYNLITFKWLGAWIRMNNVARAMAYVIDVMGNVVCQDLFNHLFLTKESKCLFGNPDMSISACLGYNKRKGTLTKRGHSLERFLHWIDPNHVEKSARWEDND